MSNELMIVKADLIQLDADCIVNDADSSLSQSSGVCGAIFAAAGPVKLQRACNMYGFCPTGSAVMTPGFDLKAKYIAHAVGPHWAGGTHAEAQKLSECYQTVLKLALEKGCRSVAFPLISAEKGGYPKEQAWQVAVQSISDFLKKNADAGLRVYLVAEDAQMQEMGNSVLQTFWNPSAQVLPHLSVTDMRPNATADGFYILQGAALKTTAAGKTFLSASAGDKTGSVPMIFWDYAGPVSSADDGKIVHIKGRISEFKGALQITLSNIRLAEEGEANLADLVPVAPIDPEQMFGEIEVLVSSMTDKDYQAVVREFLCRHAKQFMQIPAAKSVHHSFVNGLLMHTGYMLRAANFLADLYSEVIDRNLLLAGTLLHDIAKREEFTFSELGLVTDYSLKGELLGHLVMGAQEVAQIAGELQIPQEKSILLQHLLLSHHGKPEYGAAVVPMCAESELLSIIDMMDSRMEIYRENLQQTPPGEFSSRVFALDGRRVFHPHSFES